MKKNTLTKGLTLFLVVAFVTGSVAFYLKGHYRSQDLGARELMNQATWPLLSSLKPTDGVQRELEKYLGSSTLEASICRYQNVKDEIQNQFQAKSIPPELASIAFVETGFLPARGTNAAGLWNLSLFMAQFYGLFIDGNVDERADFKKETAAATKYFTTMYEVFGDWGLVILANYKGEGVLQETMRNLNTRDVVTLEKYLMPQENYLDRIAAAIILLKFRVCEPVRK